MRDFIYDFRRTFTGKFTIIMVILIVLVTVALAYASASSISSSSSSPASDAYLLPEIYQSGGSLKVVDYVVNGYGQPVPGLYISSIIYNVSEKSENPASSIYLNGTTNGHGFFNSSIPVNWTIVEYDYVSEYQSGVAVSSTNAYYENSTFGVSFYPNFHPNNVPPTASEVPGPAYFYIFPVANPTSVSNDDIFIYYAAPSGSYMPDERIYYEVANSSFTFPASSPSGMTFFKTTGGIRSTIISLPLNATATNNEVEVELFNVSGRDFNAGTVTVLYRPVSAGSVLESSLALPFEFLIPILGIFSAYFYYGKDKASGVLESIIARPVTKGRIFISRFTAGAISFLLAILIAEALADIVIFRYTGSWISSHTFFSLSLGYAAEAMAFSGLIYLASQYIKSQGALLGTGIGLFFILVLFWDLIVDIILFESHINLALKSTNILYMALSAISPSFIPTLASDLNTGVYSTVTGNALVASSVGIDAFSVVGVGLTWIIIPSVLSFLMARSRD
ncbi:MAG: ABC transporter permease subunit [Thermoplasmata archaeon]